MTRRLNGRFCDCVVVDLNTQVDYCAREGADPVANLESLIPALRQAVAWAKWYGAPVVSSLESHRQFELPNGSHSTCCVDGSEGQRKIAFTVFPRCAHIEVDNMLCCPLDLFKRYQQVIFRKRTEDLMANPKADRLLSQVPARDFVMFGIGVEESIKALALTLLARGKRTTIVVDACGYWNKSAADLALRQIGAKGARLITVNELLGRRFDRAIANRNGNRRPALPSRVTIHDTQPRDRRSAKHRPNGAGRVRKLAGQAVRKRNGRLADGKR
ncbi:MAG: isochorismatase family protein [Phycisphaerae bacterium]|jgi:nicotinamidase-related amidase